MERLSHPMIGSHLYALSLIEYSDSFEKLHIRTSKWIMYEQEVMAASNDSPARTNFIAVFCIIVQIFEEHIQALDSCQIMHVGWEIV